jgi:hypothetical protein
MLEVTIGVVAFVVGIVAGVLGERRRVAQLEARRKAEAYQRRVDTRRTKRANTQPLPTE